MSPWNFRYTPSLGCLWYRLWGELPLATMVTKILVFGVVVLIYLCTLSQLNVPLPSTPPPRGEEDMKVPPQPPIAMPSPSQPTTSQLLFSSALTTDASLPRIKARERLQSPTGTPPSRRRIRFRHPQYPHTNNVLLDFFAPDHPDGGLQYDLAMVACGVIADNRWDGWLTETVDGLQQHP